jgi:citrate lyase subunit beta/citryl-CoA lyase
VSIATRSLLYVPGDRPDRVAKAMASDADAVIVDLEDAVKPPDKAAARQVVQSLIAAATPGQMWVRINSGSEGLADLDAIGSGAGLAGLVLAKCDAVGWVDRVASAVDDSVALAPLIETARAMLDIDALLSPPRVACCHLGEIDLLADLGGHGAAGESLIEHARRVVVFASAAAARQPPIGGVHAQIDDLDGLRTGSLHLAQLGFGGRAIIHPTHAAVVNDAFTPADDLVSWAQDVIRQIDEAAHGAARDSSGSMIDEAVVRRARRILAR